MKNAALIDSNLISPLQRGPLCQRFRKIADSKVRFCLMLDATLVLLLITGTLGIALGL